MNIGGQAVIEGVMMRNKEKFTVAVRLPDGKIKSRTEKSTFFPQFFDVFFLRGVVGLGYSLYDGLKGLVWSSNQQLGKKEKLTKKEMFLSIALSILFLLGLFVIVPFFSARFIQAEGFWFDVLEGVFRMVLFLGYLVIIAQMSEVKTLFQYHGAEHKVINCYEAKKKLTVAKVKKFRCYHPRCGTSFLVLVVVLSIILFSFIEGEWWIKLWGRIILLPVLAGIGYELIQLSARFQENFLVRTAIAPGLWVQKITTREPSNKQLEVAITALKGVTD